MTGKVAVVTGGTGALGQSIVLRFLRDGATVAVPWFVPEEWAALQAAAGEARARLSGQKLDMADEGAVTAFVGFSVAYRFDLPLGPTDVALAILVLLLVGALRGAVRAIRRRRLQR